ncbi:hypothetical protein N5B55_03135 [Ralstonia pickettii]|uniref:hypothetical protein n=1 Tax=Ralstonia pickettii TaxID=329 RepID=UPI0027153F70|nr:hypothetical protein [Ralstonia pickettii]WKZ85966.1 hypothetical protein N5B55_03135 [Ralstonia pickettii]
MFKALQVLAGQAATAVIAASACTAAVAATPLEGMAPQLERMASCDASAFPGSKKDEAAAAKFVKDLKAAGVRSRHIGEPPEDQTIFMLPRPITVFGQPVSKLDNFAPPFVVIEFNMTADALAAAITRSTGQTLSRAGQGSYELATKQKLAFAGKKYPFERNIYVQSRGAKKSAYICRYDDTDPNAQGDA